MTFLSCDGGVHTAAYDAGGAMAYSYSERKSGYGEADIEIPLYMRLLAPSGQWEYHVRAPQSARVRVRSHKLARTNPNQSSDRIPSNSRANLCERTRTRADCGVWQTIDWDSAFVVALLRMRNVTVRLSKTEDPGTIPDGRKRKRAVHETIHGDRLCDAWPTVGTAFCRIAQGDTDYSKARSRPTASRARPDRVPLRLPSARADCG